MGAREHIIARSMDMFMESGLKSIRMDDIAADMGISKRTIYEIFDSKETLISECTFYYFNKQEEINNKKIATATNVIEEFLILLEDRDEEFQSNMRFMNDLQKFHPALHAKIAEDRKVYGIGLLKEKLRRGVKEGIFVSWINFEFTAFTLSSSLNNIFLNPSSYQQSNMSISLAFKYTVVCFLRGVSTSQGIAITDDIIKRFDCVVT